MLRYRKMYRFWAWETTFRGMYVKSQVLILKTKQYGLAKLYGIFCLLLLYLLQLLNLNFGVGV